MATISMHVGKIWRDPSPHVGPADTFSIVFHHAGTFCSPDCGNFTPSLPNGDFFQKGQTWPPNGAAKPNGTPPKTRYHFHKSSDRVPCKEPNGASESGFHVIHIP